MAVLAAQTNLAGPYEHRSGTWIKGFKKVADYEDGLKVQLKNAKTYIDLPSRYDFLPLHLGEAVGEATEKLEDRRARVFGARRRDDDDRMGVDPVPMAQMAHSAAPTALRGEQGVPGPPGERGAQGPPGVPPDMGPVLDLMHQRFQEHAAVRERAREQELHDELAHVNGIAARQREIARMMEEAAARFQGPQDPVRIIHEDRRPIHVVPSVDHHARQAMEHLARRQDDDHEIGVTLIQGLQHVAGRVGEGVNDLLRRFNPPDRAEEAASLIASQRPPPPPPPSGAVAKAVTTVAKAARVGPYGAAAAAKAAAIVAAPKAKAAVAALAPAPKAPPPAGGLMPGSSSGPAGWSDEALASGLQALAIPQGRSHPTAEKPGRNDHLRAPPASTEEVANAKAELAKLVRKPKKTRTVDDVNRMKDLWAKIKSRRVDAPGVTAASGVPATATVVPKVAPPLRPTPKRAAKPLTRTAPTVPLPDKSDPPARKRRAKLGDTPADGPRVLPRMKRTAAEAGLDERPRRRVRAVPV